MHVKILVVDDEEGITNSLVRFFKLNDYDVDGTTSPIEALEMVQRDNYLLVISDIMMPGMSGLELLKKLKEYNGGIQVIMITGVVSIENVLTCLQNGAAECLLKPLDNLNDLKLVVDRSISTLTRWESLIQSMVKRKK